MEFHAGLKVQVKQELPPLGYTCREGTLDCKVNQRLIDHIGLCGIITATDSVGNEEGNVCHIRFEDETRDTRTTALYHRNWLEEPHDYPAMPVPEFFTTAEEEDEAPARCGAGERTC